MTRIERMLEQLDAGDYPATRNDLREMLTLMQEMADGLAKTAEYFVDGEPINRAAKAFDAFDRWAAAPGKEEA